MCEKKERIKLSSFGVFFSSAKKNVRDVERSCYLLVSLEFSLFQFCLSKGEKMVSKHGAGRRSYVSKYLKFVVKKKSC